MQLLNELVELAEKATPGEWWIDSHGMAMVAHDDENTMIVFVTDGEQMVNPAIRHEDTGNLSHWRNDNDATFIAAANPAAILAIAEHVKELEAKLSKHIPVAGKMTAPNGWRLVPEMPTQDMLIASYQASGVYSPTSYRAMIDAAPEAPDDK